jgi:hypothetical protein
MIEDMRVRNLSPHTQRIYVDRVAKFAQYFGKAPELLGPEDVRTYQVYLIHEKGASSSLLQQTVCALRFLYRNTLGKEWALLCVATGKWRTRSPSTNQHLQRQDLLSDLLEWRLRQAS